MKKSSCHVLNTMKDEKAEGLTHFRDPQYEDPFILVVHIFLMLTIDQSGEEIFISPFY